VAKKYRFWIIALALVAGLAVIGGAAALQLTKHPDYWLSAAGLLVAVLLPIIAQLRLKGSVKTKVGRSKVSWVISSLGRPGERPDPKKPTAQRGAVGVWKCRVRQLMPCTSYVPRLPRTLCSRPEDGNGKEHFARETHCRN